MSYAELCNEAAWQKRVDELERQLAETRQAWQDCREEYDEVRRELAEARAALEDVVKNQPSCFDSFNHIQVWDYGAWMTKHKAALDYMWSLTPAALKAAREAK